MRPLLRLCARPLIVLLPPRLPADSHLLHIRAYLYCLIHRLHRHANPGRLSTGGRPKGAHIAFCANSVPGASNDSQPFDANPALTTAFPALQLPVLYVVRSSFYQPVSPQISDRTIAPRSSSTPSSSSLCGTYQRSGT